jgi:dsRNA-specific ribonuclease
MIEQFLHIKAVKTALIHPSYAKRRKIESNQALETVGDGVLDSMVASWLYDAGYKSEKTISNIRSRIVSNRNLAKIGDRIGLRKHLKVYRHRTTSKDVADCFEAVIGALKRSLGYDFVDQWLYGLIRDDVLKAISDEELNPNKEGRSEHNPVNRLQEHAQGLGLQPEKHFGYEKPQFDGKHYKIVCYWLANGQKITSFGKAATKKTARKKAAHFMLKNLQIEA